MFQKQNSAFVLARVSLWVITSAVHTDTYAISHLYLSSSLHHISVEKNLAVYVIYYS